MLTRACRVWAWVPVEVVMDQTEKTAVQDAVSACARLALWLAGELEPDNNDVAEQDLDAVYELLVAVERLLRRRRAET